MSFHTSTFAICATLCVAFVAGQIDLPSSVKTCKRDTDDYSSCLRLAIQESWPTFIDGIPELDMPVLDPFYNAELDNTYDNGEVQGRITGKDVRTYGLTKARFLAVRPHHEGDNFRLEIDVEIPKILIDGDYKAEGQLGSFKIGGKGFFNISMEDVKSTWDIEGKVVNDRWVIEHFKLLPVVGSMRVYFSDLFNGNEELNNAAMSFVNEYWPVIYRGMLPYLVEMWDRYLTEFTNKFFSKVSFAQVFP